MSSSTTSPKSYTRSGIGGAGNVHKSSGKMATPSAPRVKITKSSSNLFSTGIGGVGNVCTAQERAHLTPEELISRYILRRESCPQNYHIGIGGAGNCASSVSDNSGSSLLSSSAPSYKSTRGLSNADRIKEKFGSSKNNVLRELQRPADSISLSSKTDVSEKE